MSSAAERSARPGSAPTLARAAPPAAPTLAGDPLLGAQVGSYRLERLLGQGGMGAVYLGVHPLIGSRVAVKFLHASLGADPLLVRRFFAEAKAANLVGGEHTVRVHDLGVLPPARHYLVMEYLEGETLAALLERGPAPLELARDLLLQLCEALAAVHRSGVVHRDLKPDNVLLLERPGAAPRVKVTDFGIAKLREARGAGLTAHGVLLGTPEYMAPEQCAGEAVDGRADLYALGVIAYQLTTGRTPFAGRNPTRLLLSQQLDPPPPPSGLRPGLPAAWERLVLRALAKRPEDRFPDAPAFAAALRAALGEPSRPPAGPRREAAVEPLRLEERREISLRAEVRWGTMAFPEGMRLKDLSRGGAFLCWPGPPPALFTRLHLLLRPALGPPLSLPAEVVRHVSEAEAEAWRLPVGFAVQFSSPGAEARARLEELLRPLRPAPGAEAARGGSPEVARALEYFRLRAQAGHYEFLGAPPDAPRAQLEARRQALEEELARLGAARLTPLEAAQVQAARERLRGACAVLLAPVRRLEHDAQRGNFRGVARLLAEGLSRAVVQAKRVAFLLDRREVETRVLLHLGRARLAKGVRNLPAALAELEAALALDPLNLELHDAWAELAPAAEARR